MVFSGVIQPEHLEIVKEMNLEAEIGERQRLSLEDYEQLHENKRSPDQSILDAKKRICFRTYRKIFPQIKEEKEDTHLLNKSNE